MCSGDVVGDKVILKARNHVLEQQFLFLQASQSQLIHCRIRGQTDDNIVQIAVLNTQLLQFQPDFRFPIGHPFSSYPLEQAPIITPL
jgi:hypothetical protein